MKILKACLDNKVLWVIDDVIGGLYFINQKTFELECMIDCWKIFPHGKFGVQSLIKWKENHIVIIPEEINKNWIIYNTITGMVKYHKVVEGKYRERLIATAFDRHQLYFFPVFLCDPILIVDLNTLSCTQIIENWSGKLSGDCFKTAWTGTYNGKYVFYPQKNTKILFRLDCATQNVNQIELDIPENVIDVNYSFGELWILPISGNKLYQIDEDGVIIHTAELSVENMINAIPDFARIVVQKRYIFLLPCYRSGIYVYDKQEKKTYIISKNNLDVGRSSKKTFLRYWEYCIIDNCICFLPYLDKYIEIDLDTLICHKKDLLYPAKWSDEEKIQRCIWSHILKKDFVIVETDECDLNILLKYIQYKINKRELLKKGNVSKNIWDSLMTAFY